MDLAKQGRVYEAYLRTPHFERLRWDALERSGHKCQACSSTLVLQVHHNTYERITQEWDSDLFVLCQECHTKFHSVRPLCGLQLSQIDWVALLRFVREQMPDEPLFHLSEGADYKVCPNCGKHLPLDNEFPFCSSRCQRILVARNEAGDWGVPSRRAKMWR